MDRTPKSITWYDPVRKRRDRLQIPREDSEALELLRGSPESDFYIETYSYWRELGASIVQALYRASEVAQQRDCSP